MFSALTIITLMTLSITNYILAEFNNSKFSMFVSGFCACGAIYNLMYIL